MNFVEETPFMAVESFTVAFYVLEYIVRLGVAERRISFVFNFLSVVDVLSFLPYFVNLACLGITNVRYVGAIRVIRLQRMDPLESGTTICRKGVYDSNS